MQPLTQSGAASEKGYALKLAEERKMVAHNAECRGVEVSFVPLAMESLGGWSQEAALYTNLQNRQTSGSEAWYHPCRNSFTFVPTFVHLFVERKCNYVGSPPSVSLSLD